MNYAKASLFDGLSDASSLLDERSAEVPKGLDGTLA